MAIRYFETGIDTSSTIGKWLVISINSRSKPRLLVWQSKVLKRHLSDGTINLSTLFQSILQSAPRLARGKGKSARTNVTVIAGLLFLRLRLLFFIFRFAFKSIFLCTGTTGTGFTLRLTRSSSIINNGSELLFFAFVLLRLFSASLLRVPAYGWDYFCPVTRFVDLSRWHEASSYRLQLPVKVKKAGTFRKRHKRIDTQT